MASIHKDPRGKSPFWYCAFLGADGKRMFRSTKEKDRTAARKICFRWEEAGEQARRKELTAAASRKLLAEMVAISSGETLSFHSVEGWLNDWLASKDGSASKSTLVKYRHVIRSFLAHLGPRATASIASVSPGDHHCFSRPFAEGRSLRIHLQ